MESKSLKLYLFSFRNHGDFHEDCVNVIMKDLITLMEPKYIEVWGKFTPRGGISIDPYCNYGKWELSGKMWHSTVWQIMICIQRRWIIGKITLLNFVQCTKPEECCKVIKIKRYCMNLLHTISLLRVRRIIQRNYLSQLNE